MKKSLWKKLAALTLVLIMVMSLAACDNSKKQNDDGGGGIVAGDDNPGGNNGLSEDSPYRDKGFDLSKRETVVMYAIGEKPTDMDKVMEIVNKQYMEPWINTTLEVKFLSWGETVSL